MLLNIPWKGEPPEDFDPNDKTRWQIDADGSIWEILHPKPKSQPDLKYAENAWWHGWSNYFQLRIKRT